MELSKQVKAQPEKLARTPGIFVHGVNLLEYSKILVAFSGGKDSMACFLHVWESLQSLGLSYKEIGRRIELWHHCIDGKEGSDLMDWPCTEAYCRAVAAEFGVPIYFSWKAGGMEGEMMRDNQPTAVTRFEVPGGAVKEKGGKGDPNTRLMFPQKSADLSVRWCSAYMKIDVMATAIRNQSRFEGEKTLVVTGERAQESSARSKYKKNERHRSDLRKGKRRKRLVNHWRPILRWSERKVWRIIKDWMVRPHPAYYLGFGRVSCMTCIFASANQWATLWEIARPKVQRIARLEKQFGKTIDRTRTVMEMIERGASFLAGTDEDLADAFSHTYKPDIFVEEWRLPAGAFTGDQCGPT